MRPASVRQGDPSDLRSGSARSVRAPSRNHPAPRYVRRVRGETGRAHRSLGHSAGERESNVGKTYRPPERNPGSEEVTPPRTSLKANSKNI